MVHQLTTNDVFKCLNRAVGFVNLVKSGYLNQPTNVVRVELVIHDPFRKFVPFIRGMAVYTDTPFNILNHDICQEFLLEINSNYIPDICSAPDLSSTLKGYQSQVGEKKDVYLS